MPLYPFLGENMIDIDFNCPLDQVRALIGDCGEPETYWVNDNTIQSALVKTNNNIDTAAIMVMQVLLRKLSLLADREREGQVEVYYTKAYERYKELYDELTQTVAGKSNAGIIIGGVSIEERNEMLNDPDLFTIWDLSDWTDNLLSRRALRYEDI